MRALRSTEPSGSSVLPDVGMTNSEFTYSRGKHLVVVRCEHKSVAGGSMSSEIDRRRIARLEAIPDHVVSKSIATGHDRAATGFAAVAAVEQHLLRILGRLDQRLLRDEIPRR